ncbi:MAG: DNA-binding response regulator [Bacteroidetes bacterium GWC2_33_15]|nr:MAG: DNA-binding response regulator [Bacteroidetes bacterium GWA2_33_15]OFX52298.1 MAG: DNA-binding response regulator [Bacteroidetes bacterium GWC2_33_15]OFX64452.1 MAG: DNA-binding response regulator [Bacteroidetes bacterium GWB2_32_14]OFX67857.1 MAG: DNA-binding response regulator [Bacteroidetes bacterium GWD2_33_33]HAN19476.1 DNA-binding response regulator [Bacteroidales bacterium]
MNENETILIIDDELQIRRLLEITLSADGYKVLYSANGKEGLIDAATHHPSLIILDLGLPDIDGQEILKKLREWYFKPVIILSVRNSEDDIIKALDNGANDYLTKPFRSRELLARIRSAIRHGENKTDETLFKFGSLTIDIVNHIAKKNDEILKLTTTEFSLLCLLAKNEGRVLTHQYLLKEIWGFGYIEQTQYLRVFVAQLRKKIEDNPSKPTLLVTESGIGYRFGE